MVDILQYRTPYRLGFLVTSMFEMRVDEDAKEMQLLLNPNTASSLWQKLFEIG
jgi:hypothetical protein